uniref:Secreted protein n=1 Tax=Arundo donax TaxID=35708 RepID=A0A0A9A993_ARUDO
MRAIFYHWGSFLFLLSLLDVTFCQSIESHFLVLYVYSCSAFFRVNGNTCAIQNAVFDPTYTRIWN